MSDDELRITNGEDDNDPDTDNESRGHWKFKINERECDLYHIQYVTYVGMVHMLIN